MMTLLGMLIGVPLALLACALAGIKIPGIAGRKVVVEGAPVVRWLRHDEAIVTLTLRRGSVSSPVSFRGSCTVWNDAETGEGAPTWLCLRLHDIWRKARWDRDDAVTAEAAP